MIGTQHHLGAVLGQLLPWRKQVLPRSWGMASFLPSCRALLPGGVIELQHFPRVAASRHLTWEHCLWRNIMLENLHLPLEWVRFHPSKGHEQLCWQQGGSGAEG